MDEMPDQTPQPDEIQAEPAKPRRRSQLSYILGVGGGAILGAIIGITVAPHSWWQLPPVILGAILGGLARYVLGFALLGAVVGVIVVLGLDLRGVAGDSAARQMVFLISVAAGGVVGVAWTVLRLRQKKSVEAASTEAEARGERLQGAWICLLVGPVVGLLFGLCAGGGTYPPMLVNGIIFGVVAGFTLFLALAMSAGQ